MTLHRTPDPASARKLAPTHSLVGIMARIAADPTRSADAPTLEVPALEAPPEAQQPATPEPVAPEPRRRPSLVELLPGRGALAGIGVAVWLSILLLLLALGGGLGVRSATRLLIATLLVPAIAAAALGWLLHRQRKERHRLADQLARTRTLLDSARGLTAQDSEVAIYETLPVHVRALVAADAIGVAVFQRGRFVGRYDASGLIDGLNDVATPLEEQVVVHGRAVTLAPEPGEADAMHRLALPVRSGETVVAVLVVSRPHPFGEDESDRIATLCEHVGIALAKARLFGLVSTGKREWEGIFDALSEGLALIAPDGGVRRANIALASLAAVPPQKAVERHHHELLPFLDAGAEECAVCRTLRTGARSEHTVQRPGGVLFRLAVTPHPAGGAVLVATDLTLERRAFEAVRDAERRLAEAERLARIGRLTSGLSSEMTDPLMGILGMTSLLLDQTHDAEAVEMLEAIRREARRAAAVTSDLARAGRESEPTGPRLANAS